MNSEMNTTTKVVIDETGSLDLFYKLADRLFTKRSLRLSKREDEVDNIEWQFTYHGRTFSLQYNIYSGVTFIYNGKDEKKLDRIAHELLSDNA